MTVDMGRRSLAFAVAPFDKIGSAPDEEAGVQLPADGVSPFVRFGGYTGCAVVLRSAPAASGAGSSVGASGQPHLRFSPSLHHSSAKLSEDDRRLVLERDGMGLLLELTPPPSPPPPSPQTSPPAFALASTFSSLSASQAWRSSTSRSRGARSTT